MRRREEEEQQKEGGRRVWRIDKSEADEATTTTVDDAEIKLTESIPTSLVSRNIHQRSGGDGVQEKEVDRKRKVR